MSPKLPEPIFLPSLYFPCTMVEGPAKLENVQKELLRVGALRPCASFGTGRASLLSPQCGCPSSRTPAGLFTRCWRFAQHQVSRVLFTADCRAPPSLCRQETVERGGSARLKPLAGGHAATFAGLVWLQSRVPRSLVKSPSSRSPASQQPQPCAPAEVPWQDELYNMEN
jgi:hypothetical protein